MMGDNDFPAIKPEKKFLAKFLPEIPSTQKPTGYFREDLSGERSYAQSGTDIPSFKVGQTYGQKEGGPVYSSLTAQGIPVGEDPIFPMSQEEFRDLIWRNLDQGKPTPPLSPALQQKIQNFRARYPHIFA